LVVLGGLTISANVLVYWKFAELLNFYKSCEANLGEADLTFL